MGLAHGPSDAIWHLRTWLTQVQVMVCHGLPEGMKPLPEPVLTYHQLGLVAFT